MSRGVAWPVSILSRGTFGVSARTRQTKNGLVHVYLSRCRRTLPAPMAAGKPRKVVVDLVSDII